jgi:hypothetical protein
VNTFTCCNDTYTRGDDGAWRYPWDELVPGAQDLTIVGALALRLDDAGPRQSLSREELAWATSLCGVDEPLMVQRPGGGRQLIVGMTAPELNIVTMLTVADIGELAGVSKATIDSYRYRGYLPDPQIIKGRTPLWSRPIVRHWLSTRPGAGWRTDVYGTRERRTPVRAMPITRAREEAAQRQRRLEASHVDGQMVDQS